MQNNNDDKHRKIIRYDASDHLGFSCHMKARLFTLNLTLERKKMPNNFFTNALASDSGKAVEVNSSKID